MEQNYNIEDVAGGVSIKMWTRGVPVEDEARKQLANAARLPIVFKHIAAMPDVPFLCNFRRAVSVTDGNPYGELVRYLHTHRDRIEQVFGVLSYFDGVSMAARASASGLFSVALRDPRRDRSSSDRGPLPPSRRSVGASIGACFGR